MLNKVLIVEDSALQARMYQMVFREYEGCRLVMAENGMQGMDRLDMEREIDLIILDINMPKMNGLEFLRAMRGDGYGHIPVIVISTEGKDEDIERALELGARAYIKKPWKPEQLKELVDRIIGNGS